MSFRLLLGLVTIAAGGHTIPPGAWVAQHDSFGEVTAFRVRADVHGDTSVVPGLKNEIEQQAQAAMARNGVPIARSPRAATPTIDGIADLVVDAHVLRSAGGVAVAWTFQVSQLVRLATGPWTWAATWEVGDLLHARGDSISARVNASLNPALEEFCSAYRASRSATPAPPVVPAPTPTPTLAPTPTPTPSAGADL